MIGSRIIPILNRLKLYHSLSKKTLSEKNGYFLKKYNFAKVNSVPFRNMCDDIDKEFNDPNRYFDYDQLVKKQKQENVVIIDVREFSEIKETGRIPGSINVPLGELKKALKEMTPEDFKKHYQAKKPDKDNELIFSCKSGNRSLKAMKIGLELGYCKSGTYTGGWLDYAKKSGAIV